jgi:hypothetical protein
MKRREFITLIGGAVVVRHERKPSRIHWRGLAEQCQPT